MAVTLNEKVGETIGLRVRLQSQVSKRTRVETVTEGVFTRQILDDPSLKGSRRSCSTSSTSARSTPISALRSRSMRNRACARTCGLSVMSATLDGARVRSLIGDAPLIESKGRAYPIVTRYVGRDSSARIEGEVARVTLEAVARESGSILVFLPGLSEIRRVAEILGARAGPGVDIAPLYGALDAHAQDLAIAPAPAGRRKIVLSTSIAETSLTIEGVRVVIDSGLMRVPVYEPDVGLTRLATVRVSKANADQRRGRAGRVERGVCYRLWEEAANGGLQPYAAPEILSADLSGLMLDCAMWGVADPTQLAFLDPPPRGALTEARALLASLGAVDGDGRITDEGRAIASLALPPRLARMVVDAAREGDARTASEVAVVLTERGLGGDFIDLASRLEAFAYDRSERANDARRLARGLAARVAQAPRPTDEGSGASAPRLAVRTPHPAAPSAIETADELTFDHASFSLRARRRRRRLGALVLAQQTLAVPQDEATALAMVRGVLSLGPARLPWTKAVKQLRDRVLRRAEGEAWPDLSDEALARDPGWLNAFPSRLSCFRPPTGRSRSRATCPASGAARGAPCAPTFAAATPAISGPRTPPRPRRRPDRNPGGREGGVQVGSGRLERQLQSERFGDPENRRKPRIAGLAQRSIQRLPRQSSFLRNLRHPTRTRNRSKRIRDISASPRRRRAARSAIPVVSRRSAGSKRVVLGGRRRRRHAPWSRGRCCNDRARATDADRGSRHQAASALSRPRGLSRPRARRLASCVRKNEARPRYTERVDHESNFEFSNQDVFKTSNELSFLIFLVFLSHHEFVSIR